MLFEWLHYNKAIDKDSTPFSISDVQKQIGGFFGLQDRQATKVYANLRKRGLITDYKGRHESKSWLSFTPVFDGFIDFTETPNFNFKEWLETKIEAIK